MIVRRSIHEAYLSNAYLVADREGGSAVIIDTGAPIEPLLEAVETLGVTVTHVLNTHEHHDHTLFNVELQERFGAPLLGPSDLADGEPVKSGGLHIVALATPGHTGEHVAFLVDDAACFTGDLIFRGSVGGTLGAGPNGFAALRHSIMQRVMSLPDGVVLYPGHTDETTVGAEREHNPFVRVWAGTDPEGTATVRVNGRDCTLVVEAHDYDGGTKAWVRFEDGREAIVGGSMVERAGATA